jgi:hypothetical protein
VTPPVELAPEVTAAVELVQGVTPAVELGAPHRHTGPRIPPKSTRTVTPEAATRRG